MGVSMNIISYKNVLTEFFYFVCYRKWREEQANMLQEKDEEERKALEELRENAHKELDDWYNHHEDTLKIAKDSNR